MRDPVKPKGTRTGFTTGACAAAAARAAAAGLVNGTMADAVECLLPNGKRVRFAVAESHLETAYARAVIIKDAGDDPDRTHGAHLTAEVRLLPEAPGAVRLKGGAGVGTVTQPGLGLEVGTPAINPVPRRNIEENVREVAASLLAHRGLEVTISVPGGDVMAQKTLNGRLGIVGGISILGTSGIVRPYSTAAFRESVIQGVEVAAAQGQDIVVLTTGGRTEKFAMRQLPELPAVCFVQMGDFLRHALKTVVKQGIRHVVIGGMVGKLAKMAQGETLTHAMRTDVDTALLAELAARIGAEEALCADIREAKTARYALERLTECGLADAFHQALAESAARAILAHYPGKFSLRILMCDFEGERLCSLSMPVGAVREPPSLPT